MAAADMHPTIDELLERVFCAVPAEAEAGSWGRGRFGNPEEGDHPSLEAVTKQRSEDREH
jgi:hypothetical protein